MQQGIEDVVDHDESGTDGAGRSRRRILVFQHAAICHPGMFRTFLAAEGIAWEGVRLDVGEPIPDLAGYDALWVLGGPQDVWQEAEHPWLHAEKAAIREAVVERGMPFLGICLGHQLLAEALGGEVGPAERPEIGLFEVEKAAAGRAHPLLAGLPVKARLLQCHMAEVCRAPPGAVVLARSEACAIQAFAWGERALGIQFHAEVDPPTLAEWLAEPLVRARLGELLGAGGLDRFEAETRIREAELHHAARALYDSLRTILATRPGR
jgi:GMP synthase-like glutamine amidotransferase